MTQNNVYLEGPLSKWTNLVNGWQYRWFVLNYQSGMLTYYTSRDKMKKGSRRGCVYLQKAMIGIDDEDDSGFSITSDSKQFHFQARDSQDREKWVRALEYAIFNQRNKAIASSANLPATTAEPEHHSAPVSPRFYNSPMMTNISPKLSMDQLINDKNCSYKNVPFDSCLNQTFDFDSKIAEADAYLQILINQMKALESKSNLMNEEDEMRKKYLEIKISTNALIDSVKHSIVILQITRNAVFPSSGIYQSTLPPLIVASTSNITWGTLPIDGNAPSSPSIPFRDKSNSPDIQSIIPIQRPASVQHLPRVQDTVSSFSTSEDDDNTQDEEHLYFDAEEDTHIAENSDLRKDAVAKAVILTTDSISPQALADQARKGRRPSTENSTILTPVNQVPPPTPNYSPNPGRRPIPAKHLKDHAVDEIKDRDTLFQDSSEEELEDISNYGGMVKHLVSQVRIGMDLTKVTLPTFILERRSLLEMFADFFAHSTLFSNVTDKETPKERMTEMVKYYLSSFHAGRKSAVAKKPFNPVLGEVFTCFWVNATQDDRDDIEFTPNPTAREENKRVDVKKDAAIDKTLLDEGPAFWCDNVNDLTFVAEQVSHHPPISAFYAENIAKKVCLNANIWTKSKFLGLSIGVHMIGQACINLLQHNEEYVCTFPNAYARSIFSIPWIELGGKVTITCSKTGYFANIEFLTKPFYGGNKNQINCEVFSPYEKNPYLTVSGAWNGTMYIKDPAGECHEFLDTSSMPIQSKVVLPIHAQREYESRKIWYDVAKCLKAKRLEMATEIKHEIEEKQRSKARERSESAVKWECQFFEEINGNWIYKKPLYKRLSKNIDE